MKKSIPACACFLAYIVFILGCKPINEAEFTTLKAAQQTLNASQLPKWLPADAGYLKIHIDDTKGTQFLRFKTSTADQWLPPICYRSNFINQLPSDLPPWWPNNAISYRQLNIHYRLHLCKDDELWWVAVPAQPEFILMWK